MTDNIVPFGKYKGQAIEDVVARDPQYVQWLTGQAWFVEKFQHLSVTINHFGTAPEETPEHNAMQVRFLDERYRNALMAALGISAAIQDELASAVKASTPIRYLSAQHYARHARWREKQGFEPDPHRRDELTRNWLSRQRLRAAKACIDAGEYKFSIASNDVRFEEGADVVFRADFMLDAGPGHSRQTDRVFSIEIKPSIGDDFPAVLRQVKRQPTPSSASMASGKKILLVGDYAGTGASLDQVRQVFAASHITVVLAAEVEAELRQERKS